MSSNSGNTKVSKEDVSSKVFSSGKRYTFVGDRTVSTVSAGISYIEFID